MTNKKVIGIDLGGTTIKFAILTAAGEIQQRWSIPTDILNDGQNIIPSTIATINEHLQMYQLTPADFLGIGIGTPGSVDYEQGTVDSAFNLNWDHPVALKAQLEAGTNIPVTLENDANVAALGEKWQGAGNNAANVAFVTLGTGVGGGIIINNQIVHGVGGSAGEIGHITVDAQGFACTCGKKGCLETVASATGIVRVANALSQEYAGPAQLKALIDDGQQVSSKDVFDLAQQADPLAQMVVKQICDQLGLALANVAMTLNPKYIIIGGGVSNAGEYLLNQVQTAYLKYVFPAVKKTTTLRLATLGNEAGVIGAASLVIQP
ncbi:ROK family glucokinase [Bombilactobacillus folatiphilus]|uniref:Glucokinase n=1 Tax=Bombilactobacillus folatiphilus TaxID=2923362 RepID=A0ABY4P9Y7_9LACO|nr:ROK family glucokinase [Bombilactobacillus folatiphilus]UQS82563.1 ROK family glucokinase [Bombilactobacillus folatiphilus]